MCLRKGRNVPASLSSPFLFCSVPPVGQTLPETSGQQRPGEAIQRGPTSGVGDGSGVGGGHGGKQPASRDECPVRTLILGESPAPGSCGALHPQKTKHTGPVLPDFTGVPEEGRTICLLVFCPHFKGLIFSTVHAVLTTAQTSPIAHEI